MSSKSPASPQFFISYCVDDKKFVYEVCRVLEPYLDRERMFLFEKSKTLETDFLKRMKREMKAADCAIVFVGSRFGDYQWVEVADAIVRKKRMCFVAVGGQEGPEKFPDVIRNHAGGREMVFDRYTRSVPPDDVACAKSILETLSDWMKAEYKDKWKPWTDKYLLYGLPSSPQLFDYEKKIIEFFAAKRCYERIGVSDDESAVSASVGHRRKKLLEQWPLEKIRELLEKGVPGDWPIVRRYEARRNNLLDQRKAGDFRGAEEGEEALVRAAALLDLDPPGDQLFTFPEAGPRPKLAFPQARSSKQMKVGILVAGGIAPGINAVIDAIVQRHYAYHAAAGHQGYELNVFGIRDGFLAIKGGALSSHIQDLKTHDTIEQATRGGSMLGTSRDEELLSSSSRAKRLRTIAEALSQPGRAFDILYIIGGDGGMKAAHALWRMAKQVRSESQHDEIRGRELSVVAIPKTMDNDILWVWQSFGFLSAVDESRKIVETLHTEVRSNPRLGIVQLFGSDSGFVVSHAVLAAAVGHATLALIPEIKFSAIGVARYLKERLWKAARPRDGQNQFSTIDIDAPIDPNFPHGLVVLAETAIPQDALECLGLVKDVSSKFAAAYDEIAKKFRLDDKEKQEITDFVRLRKEQRGFEGQTNDTVRQLGLRLLAEAIPVFINDENLRVGNGLDHNEPTWPQPTWKHLRVVCSEPRHLVRALEPSTSDIITGQRLGLLAVDAAMAGYTDCLISQWLTEFALVPLELAVLGRKRIPSDGMFWKSVTSKTGQPADLVSPHPLESEIGRTLSASEAT
jgi:6-phosphofructokinase